MSGGWGSDKSVFLTNEVNCFCSWISSFHFFLVFFLFVFRLRRHPDVYHFLPIIYESSVWTINCASRTAPTDLHTGWKNLQDPSCVCVSAWALQILLSSLLFSGITSVRSRGSHTFHSSVEGGSTSLSQSEHGHIHGRHLITSTGRNAICAHLTVQWILVENLWIL